MQTTGKGAPVVEIHLPKKWANPNYWSSLADDMTEATDALLNKKHLSDISNLAILYNTIYCVKVEN